MKQSILILLFSFSIIAYINAQNTGSVDSVRAEQVEKDGNVNYPKKLLVNPDFDFKLKKSAAGKFIVSFYKEDEKPVTIKIFDLLGNLVVQETVNQSGPYSKEYNLSYYKPKFFVVEAGSSQYNKTKSIIVE